MDTQPPTLGAPQFGFALGLTTELLPDPPPPSRKIDITWVPVVICAVAGSPNCEDTAAGVTRSWTPGLAHYEIWYGKDEDEVNERKDLSVAEGGDGSSLFPNSVYVWEDIAFGSSGLPHEPNCTWDLSNPPGAGDKDCYDSALGTITTGATSIYTAITKSQVPDPFFQICAVDDFGNETCYSTGAKQGVQTLYGDVYSSNSLINQDRPTYNNATYLLMANGTIDKWTTSQTMPGGWPYPWPDPNYPAGAEILPFPSKVNNYTAATSSLPYLIGLDNNSSFASVVTKLQAMYGSARVKTTSNLDVVAASLENPLGGKIYICDGSCLTGGTATVATALSLRNGNHGGLDLDGSGLIIVNGNLRVSADVTYAAAPAVTPAAAKLKHLASITWLVLGDVVVDGAVKDLAGTFLILGRPDAPAVPSATDLTTLSGFGRLDTCYTGSCVTNSLTIRGLVVSRYFYLRRTKASLSEGSEVVIYDGRVLANTPPGLEDLVKSLPKWGEGN